MLALSFVIFLLSKCQLWSLVKSKLEFIYRPIEPQMCVANVNTKLILPTTKFSKKNQIKEIVNSKFFVKSSKRFDLVSLEKQNSLFTVNFH